MGGEKPLFSALLVGSLLPGLPIALGEALADEPVSTAPISQYSPLIESSKRGDLAAVLALLDEPGAEAAVAQTDGLGRTALHYAARLGHQKVVQALLVRGAAVDVRDKSGYTPLLRAAQGGDVNVETVMILLEAGADPSAKAEGDDPLSIAQSIGADQLVQLLRQYSDK